MRGPNDQPTDGGSDDSGNDSGYNYQPDPDISEVLERGERYDGLETR